MDPVWPSYWRDFFALNKLEGRNVIVGETSDPAGGGADFRLLSQEESEEEVEDGVSKDAFGLGFFPIGICLLGTGNGYYLNRNDQGQGPVYTINWDAVPSDGVFSDSDIEVVLASYRQIIDCLEGAANQRQ